MPAKRRPKRGSRAYYPRVRASDHAARVRSWPLVEEVGLLGFPGYKAGMTHVHMIEDRPTAPEKGREVVRPVTAVDCPPVKAFGLRMYSANRYGRFSRTEVWSSDLDKELTRTIRRLPKENDPEKGLSEMEKSMDQAEDFTVILHTMPKLTGIKKKPDVLEVALGGGSVADKYAFGKGILGKEVRVPEVFKAGEMVDIIAVTKGKGFQGPVKRFGIKIRNRKTNDARRNPGTLGPWHPHQVMWTVPMAGQTGYQQRTEHNKRLLAIGGSDEPVRPKGGFLRYGEISGDYVLLMGSIPGPTKRLMNMRKAMRPWRHLPEEPPALIAVSMASPQGK